MGTGAPHEQRGVHKKARCSACEATRVGGQTARQRVASTRCLRTPRTHTTQPPCPPLCHPASAHPPPPLLCNRKKPRPLTRPPQCRPLPSPIPHKNAAVAASSVTPRHAAASLGPGPLHHCRAGLCPAASVAVFFFVCAGHQPHCPEVVGRHAGGDRRAGEPPRVLRAVQPAGGAPAVEPMVRVFDA